MRGGACPPKRETAASEGLFSRLAALCRRLFRAASSRPGLVLGALEVFQLLLVLGAPLGRFAWGGQHRVRPVALRAGSVVSIFIYGLVAAIVLARADLVLPGVRDGVVATVAWVVVAYFFLGIGMNLASRSRPERAVMTPVAAVLCAACAVVALG